MNKIEYNEPVTIIHSCQYLGQGKTNYGSSISILSEKNNIYEALKSNFLSYKSGTYQIFTLWLSVLSKQNHDIPVNVEETTLPRFQSLLFPSKICSKFHMGLDFLSSIEKRNKCNWLRYFDNLDYYSVIYFCQAQFLFFAMLVILWGCKLVDFILFFKVPFLSSVISFDE